MALTFNEFTSADYPAVREVWLAAGLSLNISDELPEMMKALERDPELFIVARKEGEIVGAVLGRFDGRRGHIYHLAVHPRHQGQSIGRELMVEVTRTFLAKGCRKINLHVTPGNKKVMGFYAKLGFEFSELFYMSKWIAPAK